MYQIATNLHVSLAFVFSSSWEGLLEQKLNDTENDIMH